MFTEIVTPEREILRLTHKLLLKNPTVLQSQCCQESSPHAIAVESDDPRARKRPRAAQCPKRTVSEALRRPENENHGVRLAGISAGGPVNPRSKIPFSVSVLTCVRTLSATANRRCPRATSSHVGRFFQAKHCSSPAASDPESNVWISRLSPSASSTVHPGSSPA